MPTKAYSSLLNLHTFVSGKVKGKSKRKNISDMLVKTSIEVLCISEDILYHSNSEIYGKEPPYINEHVETS